MEEGGSQGGKIREILEANDIKKIYHRTIKIKKEAFFFAILLLSEFCLEVVFALKNRKDLLHF